MVDDAWFSVCNRTVFFTDWDKPSKMQDWKAYFIFLRAADDFIAEKYRVHNSASTNTGQGSYFLELEDRFEEKVVEYFKVKEYSPPNCTTFKGPAN